MRNANSIPVDKTPLVRRIGIVKFYRPREHDAFGFISPEEGGGDVFVDSDAVSVLGIPALARGMRIEYSLLDTNRKGRPKAVELSLLSTNNQSAGNKSKRRKVTNSNKARFRGAAFKSNNREFPISVVLVEGKAPTKVPLSVLEKSGINIRAFLCSAYVYVQISSLSGQEETVATEISLY